MEYKPHLEINLTHLTAWETMDMTDERKYQLEYENPVRNMLSRKGLYLFGEDLTDRYGDLSLSEILKQNKGFVQGHNRRNPRQQGKLTPTWHDILMSLLITPDNDLYPMLLAYHLKHIGLLQIDEFLDYQLEKYHAGDFPPFSRLLALILRQYEEMVLSEKVIITVREWMEVKAARQEKEEGTAGKKRGGVNRRAEDRLTILNRGQTILLIHYLKEAGVFLKDEYLTDLDAGKAFEVLTGYSQHTIRQDLGKFYQFQTKENLKELHRALSQALRQVEKHLG